MKFKFRVRMPSLKKRLSARTSISRIARHSWGFKAPRGFGWLTNPKKALYNRIYSRTTIDPLAAATPSFGKGSRRKARPYHLIVGLLWLFIIAVAIKACSR